MSFIGSWYSISWYDIPSFCIENDFTIHSRTRLGMGGGGGWGWRLGLQMMSESLSEQTVIEIHRAVEKGDATSGGMIPLSAFFLVAGEIGSLEIAERLKVAAFEVCGKTGMQMGRWEIGVQEGNLRLCLIGWGWE